MASELTLIHGVPPGCDEREYLSELQNALLWINYRYYLAPLFWFVVGCRALIAYSVLRARQTWLALPDAAPPVAVRDRWYPAYCGLAAGASGGVVYARWAMVALPAWFASLGDRHSSQYQVLTRLAQYSGP